MPNEEKPEKWLAEVETAFDTKVELTMGVDIWETKDLNVEARHIIWGAETFYIKPHWELKGKLARHITGTWRVKVDLESLGTAKEYTSKTVEIQMDPCKKPGEEYFTIFELKPGDLEPHEDGTVYKPVVTLSSLDPCGGDGHIYGYAVGKGVMFINTKPDT